MAWQFVAIITASVLTATLTTAGWSTAFRTWTTRRGTALTFSTVVKTWVATLFLSTNAITLTVTAAFTATIALAFKTRGALWAIAA